MFAVLGATVAGLLVGGAGAPGAARMPAVRMEARMHSGTFTEHTHLSMHHKVIPSSGAAAASSATDLTLRQEPTRDDVIGAARNLQMGTQTHLGMHNVVIPSASSAKAVKAAPVQEEVKDLKQGHQEGGADSDGKNFADAGINHQVQVNP